MIQSVVVVEDQVFTAAAFGMADSILGNSDALDFLGWLSRHAEGQGRPLKQGDVVITGARIGPLPMTGALRACATAMGATATVRMG